MNIESDFKQVYKDKKLIAFDLYGTCLERTNKIVLKSSKELLELFQIKQVSLEDVQKFFQMSDEEYSDFLSNFQKDIEGIKLYDDVIPTFEFLKKNGYKIAVISNLANIYGEPIDKLFPKGLIDYKVLSYNEGCLKPNKEIFHKLEEKSGIKSDKIAMIGDNLKLDVRGGINAGIDSIHINRNCENGGIKDKKIYIEISTLRDLIDVLL